MAIWVRLSGVGSLIVSNESEYLRVAKEAMGRDAQEMQAAFLSSIALSLAKIADHMEAKTLDFDALAPRD
ncbi:hypothetical protein BKG71_00060 [Mycobacteroides chelonae]|nr:hypothetical protein BKG63_24375 [Mycobacteroides chelonae]OHT99602.1 hypothetical protein BKG72_04045 [Mycobacteroides chelonae]OHU07711.1 hypothetical protein BKG71_00060 [Mycobacteroides chelonae]OLT92936.1 hypothetical protein BKG59_05760 [Mycobacteroides chelonae]